MRHARRIGWLTESSPQNRASRASHKTCRRQTQTVRCVSGEDFNVRGSSFVSVQEDCDSTDEGVVVGDPRVTSRREGLVTWSRP
ncbi:MAG: hypothetical protein CMJ21_03835 [Phycisphaerae bacterium]|nr:hypothetical protein [Phycisphaerae bacterium]